MLRVTFDGMRGADKEIEGGNLCSKKVMVEKRHGDTKSRKKENDSGGRKGSKVGGRDHGKYTRRRRRKAGRVGWV